MTNRIAPPPRPSGHTVVGLGAVEARNGNGHRDETPTPPSGIDLDTLGQMGLEGGMLYLGEQLKRLGDERRLDRSLIERSAMHSEMAANRADAAKEEVKALRGDVAGIRLVIEGDVMPSIKAIAKRVGAVEKGPREGSHPQLEQLASLAVEDATTEVRRRRAQLEEEAAARALRIANRARMWAIAWKVAAVVGPFIGAAFVRACGG